MANPNTAPPQPDNTDGTIRQSGGVNINDAQIGHIDQITATTAQTIIGNGTTITGSTFTTWVGDTHYHAAPTWHPRPEPSRETAQLLLESMPLSFVPAITPL